MKYSFLLPSKNRLDLLRHAVDSIRRQGIPDYEIVIADNASGEDYAAYVKSLGDPRVVYTRAAHPVPVTDNWNRALELARGDYVLMLGDDDALAPAFLDSVTAALRQHPAPDVVYLAAYHYCYPHVLPGHDAGYLADVRNSRFLADRSAPFELPREEARAVAQAAFGFRYLFAFNSQHFLFRAGFLRELAALGGVFQSPYPDTFAATVSFLKARSVVVLPQPVVLIGISPKSFGYYYFNDRPAQGYEFLDNAALSAQARAALEGALLPGDPNNTNWLIAVEAARRALAPEFPLAVDIARYRQLQCAAFLRAVFAKGTRSAAEIPAFTARLDPVERGAFDTLRARIEAATARGTAEQARAFAAIDRELGQFWPAQVRMIDIGRHASIRDAVDWLAAHPARPRRSLLQRLGLA